MSEYLWDVDVRIYIALGRRCTRLCSIMALGMIDTLDQGCRIPRGSLILIQLGSCKHVLSFYRSLVHCL